MINLIFLVRFTSILMLLGIVVISPFGNSWEMAILLAQCFLLSSALGFLEIILDKSRGAVSFMYQFFILLFVALPAKFQISAQTFPWFTALKPLYICWSLGLLAISQIIFMVGITTQQRICRNKKYNVSISRLRNEDVIFYTKWTWALAVVALIFTILAGPTNLFIPRFEAYEVAHEGMTHQFISISRSLSLLVMIMLIFLIKYTGKSSLKRWNKFILLIFFIPFVCINYLPALPRFFLFGILISISTLFIDYFRPRNKVLISLTSVALLFFVFPVIKLIGSYGLQISDIFQRIDLDLVSLYLLRVDFDAFMQIISTVKYYALDIGPIRYGENFLGVALFFIPAAIWAGKPIHSGELISTALGYNFTNVSNPLHAEALVGFGLLGPIIVFFLLGFYISKIEFYARSHLENPSKAYSFFIYAILAGFIVIIMRGALNAVATQFGTAFLVVYVLQLARKYRFKFN